MLLLMKNEVLMKPNIFDYLTGKNNRNFQSILSKERLNLMNVYADVLEMSVYGMICFDSHFSIIHSNAAAEELFRIKSSGSKNLSDIFVEEAVRSVKIWKNRKLRTTFNGEIMAKYNDQEYAVIADISRHDLHHNVFIGIFENLESIKKKEFLKEAERRNQKIDILMRNILPLEIAKSTKMKDFEIGKCVVYEHKRATSYFMDICNFSGIAQKTNPKIIVNVLHRLFSNIDVICCEHNMEKIKTIGDCYFAVSGIPM
jgi:hypothetical protein